MRGRPGRPIVDDGEGFTVVDEISSRDTSRREGFGRRRSSDAQRRKATLPWPRVDARQHRALIGPEISLVAAVHDV